MLLSPEGVLSVPKSQVSPDPLSYEFTFEHVLGLPDLPPGSFALK
jgi:hypothetical protein